MNNQWTLQHLIVLDRIKAWHDWRSTVRQWSKVFQSESVLAAQWPHSSPIAEMKVYIYCRPQTPRFYFSSSFQPLSLHRSPSRPLSRRTADYRRSGQRRASAAARKLRRFNFLLFIVATQTTFKILPFRLVPLPSRLNLRRSRPKIFPAQQSPDDLPSRKNWLELQSWLDGLRGIKNQAITVKNWNLVFCMGVVCRGEEGIRLKLDWRLNGE